MAQWLNRSLNKLKSIGPLRTLTDQLPRGVKANLRAFVDRISRPSKTDILIQEAGITNTMLSRIMYEVALSNPRFQEPKRLLRHGFKVYSQHDEDGIQEEIFRRIDCTNRYFVEFGVGDGAENGTLYCLLKGWHGAWIEASAICYNTLERKLAFLRESGHLSTLHSFITAENVEDLFRVLKVPEEFDLLSIDIDNNDFWVWKAIVKFRPRVVAIEYNASFRHTVSCVVPYRRIAIWDYSNYYGASLKALEELGKRKGYNLVGCNFTGVTAFFVRADLVANHFAEPFTAENHFEPPRYLMRMPNGHPPGFGPTQTITAETFASD